MKSSFAAPGTGGALPSSYAKSSALGHTCTCASIMDARIAMRRLETRVETVTLGRTRLAAAASMVMRLRSCGVERNALLTRAVKQF